MLSKIYGKTVTSYIDEIIRCYSEVDADDKYIVDLHKVSLEELYKLCGYMLIANDELMIEITDTDNKYFQQYINPSIIFNLTHSDNSCSARDMADSVNKGIYLILSDRIDELFEERLDIYNGLMEDKQDYEGDRAWM